METVADLRQTLISLGLSEAEAEEIKGKTNLSNKIAELRADFESQEMFEEAEIDDDNIEINEEVIINDPTVVRPEMTDPAWPDFVLSHLVDNEKSDGHPKSDGLRRLTELFIGKILEINTEVPQCPNVENENHATVIVSIVVDSQHGPLKASGAADVFRGNTESVFCRHSVATAETRAEGRAYRKMLRLVNVITAEELVNEKHLDIDYGVDKIESAQIRMIDQMCLPEKLNINVEKLLNNMDISLDKFNNISKSKAQEICQRINAYQYEIPIPEEIKGYQHNWSKT